jgi:eukaryotic-like serine/threonine-protein kinase
MLRARRRVGLSCTDMAKPPPSSDRPEAETVVLSGLLRPSADDDPTPESPESASTNDTAMPLRRHAEQPAVEFTGPPKAWPERFALRRVLGHGGTSFVLAAADRDLKREVAIKILRDDAREEEGALARFLREAEVTANLEHPNIVPVYDVETTDGLTYLVMRHVRGEALGRLIRRARRDGRTEVMPTNDLVNVFLKVCEAIAFAHHRGVLHRDIKPDNVMVGDFGEVMVVDWGAASSVGTSDAVMVGTPHYMSPEQIRGFPATPASDVYALGATLFYALLLRRPVEGEQDDAFWGKKLEGQIDPPTSEERMRVPRALLEIVEKALCPRPEDRHSSALALAAELRNYQAGRTEWSSPGVVETFTDDWQTRWCPVDPDQFEVEGGGLISRSERDARAFYRRRLTAPVAVEFEGQILPGAKAGDLSVIWTETDVFVGGEIDAALKGRTYTLQVGAYANIRAGIFGSASIGFHQKSIALSARPFVLEPGRTYSIRAEIDERVLRLFVDGQLVCEHEDLFPLRSGYVGLYAFYAGKSFRNVRICTKGMPERVSPIVVGDEFYKCDDFEKALLQYRRVADAHAGELLAEEAAYKQGLCMYRLGRRTDAHLCWSALTDPTYRAYAAVHSMDDAFEAGDHTSGAAQFRHLHANTAALRPILRSNWSAYVRGASDIAALQTLIALRDEVFPGDAVTSDAAANALERSGRWQDVLDGYPTERLW